MEPEPNSVTGDQALSSQLKIVDLEQRYIKLLESRILQLEQRSSELDVKFATGRRPKSPAPDTTDTDSNVGVNGDHNGSVKNDDQDTEPDVEEDSRYAVIISKWNPDTGDFHTTESTKKEEKKPIGPENRSKRAFTLKRLIWTRSRHSSRLSETKSISSEITIESEPLQRLLGKLTSTWGWGESVTTWASPYSPLVYAWSEAEQEAKRSVEGESEEDKQARTDLGVLLTMISTDSGHLPLDRYFRDRKTFMEEKTITHATLWTLFPSGTPIIAKPFLDEPQIFTVSSCDSFVEDVDTFDVVCFCFDWNGMKFSRVPFEMKISYWGPDRRSIVELPFYPLKYYTGSRLDGPKSSTEPITQLKSDLIKRGKQFVKYCVSQNGEKMFKYNGDALFHTGRSLLHRTDNTDNGDSRRSDESTNASGHGGSRARKEAQYMSRKRIDGTTTMVDFDSFFEYLSPTSPILGNLTRYEDELESLSPERRANPVFKEMYKFDWDNHGPNKPMTDDQYLHCPPRVLGYALKEKKWAQLLVNGLSAPNPADASVFEEKLQLDEEAKKLVKWSVQAHEEGKKVDTKGESRSLQDFAPDKGKGLVIMLYGFPGVGKTLTAESVALMAGKPLLSVGVSDIGIEGDKVEANLQKVFHLAGKWEAVLLFDEADVFLEARGEGENDLQRNAMVSVLLRVLEYYNGILILTTNRMKSFDIAVQSRIHIAIKYDELDSDQQFAIFESFLKQLKGKKLVEDYDDLITWARKDGKKLSFNGRQIRNVVSTAMNIALVENREGGGKLKREHLVKVAQQTKDFKQELKSQDEIYKARTK